MIKFLKKSSINYVVPQAIFWRPILYFAFSIRQEADDLDEYEVASYSIGNVANFDLRHYAGHPKFTVSLYLPFDIKDDQEIAACVDAIVQGLNLPQSAVAWRRGIEFTYGKLDRPANDRLHESEARILALKLAASQRGHHATTSEIKRLAPRYFDPSPTDLRPSLTRNEPMWKQIVGNVVSHEKSGLGPFSQGYAKREKDGLTVTASGLDYLNNMGFAVS